MITKISLYNYKCFSRHHFIFKNLSVVVGKNNAGKSTLIEALRFISIVSEKYKNLHFLDTPTWITEKAGSKGVMPSLEGLRINYDNLFTQYDSKVGYSTIFVKFKNNTELKIFVSVIDEKPTLFAYIINSDGMPAFNSNSAKNIDIPIVKILPQITPIRTSEEHLDDHYVKQHLSHYLSSAHFRNQLYLFRREYFNEFKTISEECWPGLQIKEITTNHNRISLLVRDGDFITEIGNMGHGLQMWLQTMWFIARVEGPKKTVVVLDEPDVYLHADLQRKLLRLIKNRFRQTIVATHSVEIIQEVSPKNILIIDKAREYSKHADKMANVQKVLNNLGGIINLQLIRWSYARKILFLEGEEDLKVLSLFHKILYPQSNAPHETIPFLPIGGWGGWESYRDALETKMVNCFNDTMVKYCILDRDYHTEDEINKRYLEAKDRNVQLYIWNFKEIENYFLVPSAISRIINNKIKHKGIRIDEELIAQVIDAEIEKHKNDIILNYQEEYQKRHRPPSTKTAYKKAEEYVEGKWSNRATKWAIAPGKQIVGYLSAWAHREYSVKIDITTISDHLKKEEVHVEIKDAINAIEYLKKFGQT